MSSPVKCLNQGEAARALGVDPRVYWAVEKDRAPVVMVNELLTRFDRFRPTTGELCSLARRRSGAPLRVVCEGIGITKPIYLRAEAGGEPRVVAWWTQQGFQFPEGCGSSHR